MSSQRPNPRIIAMIGGAGMLQQQEKFFFPAIRFKRSQQLTEKKLKWNWAEKDHKIYPSQIKSWTMCPHRYIHTDVHKPPSFTIEALYKMEMGTYMHQMYQDCAKEIVDLLWEPPSFDGVEFPGQPNVIKELIEKQKEINPEVPVVDWLSGVSGRADAVLNIYGKPVVFDIKTTSVEDVRKDPKTGEWEENRWAEYIQKLPSEEHKIQVSIYCYLMNKYVYYKQPIRKAGLGYVNLLMKQGDPNSEHEVYFDFDEEREKKIGLLLEHIGLERRNFLTGVESKCSYPQCRAHFISKLARENAEQ